MINTLKQALEALEYHQEQTRPIDKTQEAIQSLEQLIQDIEKNEPVLVVEKEPDYMSRGHFHAGTKPHIDPTKVWNLAIGTPLYTHPLKQKPLTDEMKKQMKENCDYVEMRGAFVNGWRSAEKAHGIGE